MVETLEEVEKISDFLKYPPIGQRTYGVNRAHSFGLNFNNYVKNWNRESILIVQIESKKGVENIESIVSHPSIDGVMIGPYDLSGSYGVPGEVTSQIVTKASIKVVEACKKFNKSCGTQLSIPSKVSIQEAIQIGYSFIILGSDLFALTNWSSNMTEIIKDFR
jgi:2-dehydro-3-deoxyglucarate aldolase